MRETLLTGAILVSLAVGAPVSAQGSASAPSAAPTPAAPAALPASAPEEAAPAPPEKEGAWMTGHGGWGMPGGPMMEMRREMWRRAMMMRRNPQQFCIDRLARRAARRAYVETELNLTAAQRPLWDKLQTIAQNEQQKERALCNQLKPGEQLTMLDRMNRAQQFLSARLDALQAAKPAVAALYQALTPEQRAIFDHPFRRE